MPISQLLEIKAALNILKPVDQVFEAIVDPKKMKHYFIATSTGRMESGKTVIWSFPEMDIQFPVKIDAVEKNRLIIYRWEDISDNTETTVEITLAKTTDFSTKVTVTEKSRPNDEAGVKWLKGNTEGWANFLVCLKAYLEYGINLRKGAFDQSQMPEKK